jgi:hypothetical protein
MAVTNFSPLLGLALPTTGDLSGTWGTTVNDAITSLIDSAVAGTTTLSADTDVTLSTTNGVANQARNAIILWTASGSVTRNITAPAQSKAYLVINATGGSQSIVIRGSGPTAGVTIPAATRALVAWNGSDFITVVSNPISLTTGVSGVLPVLNGGTATSTGALTNCTADGTNAVGFLNIPINSQSANYTLVLTDAGKSIFHPSTDANSRTFTIPANGAVPYSLGTAISFLNMSANALTIAITTDTMYLSSAGTTGSRTLAQYGSATAIKMTSTTWMIAGSGLT